MLSISQAAKLEKNKIEGDTAWLILMEIYVTPSIILRLVRNTEDITWNGETWVSI